MAILAGNAQNQENIKRPQYMLVVGDIAAIIIHDPQFFEGFQIGSNGFPKGTVPTDKELYAKCLQIIDVNHSGMYQSGLIVGSILAMFSDETKLFDIAQDQDAAAETLHQDH